MMKPIYEKKFMCVISIVYEDEINLSFEVRNREALSQWCYLLLKKQKNKAQLLIKCF